MTFYEGEAVKARKSFFARKWKRYSFYGLIGAAGNDFAVYTTFFSFSNMSIWRI